VTDPGQAVVVGPGGRVVALQAEPLARWEDGSVKWLLLDFFADIAAGQSNDYKLLYGADAAGVAAPPSPPLTWRRTDSGVYVDTGALRAEFSRRVIERLSVRDANGAWIDVVTQPGELTVGVNGQNAGRYLSSLDPAPEIVVEQPGPNRLCVRVSGWRHSADGRRFAPYTLRIHAYAGKPYLRIFHTFVNSDLPERGLMTDIGLRVALPVRRGDRVGFGDEPRPLAGGWPSSLEQIDADRRRVTHDGMPVVGVETAGASVSLHNRDWTAACFVRDARRLYPMRLDLDPRGLTFWAWPGSVGPLDLRRAEQREPDDFIAFRERYPEAYAEWIDPGTARSAGFSARRHRVALRQNNLSAVAAGSALGLARTHELWWVFEAGDIGAERLVGMAAAVDEPLLPFVDPEHLDETGALGRVGWLDREAFPRVENYIARKADWIIRHQNEWSRWWGLLDYGDVQSIYEQLRDTRMPGQWLKYMGRHGWKNSEVDVPNHFMYLYLRSGDRRLFRFYEAAVRHLIDVDTMHLNLPDFERPGHPWQDGQWTRGGVHRHSYDHYSGGPNIGHAWNEGMANYYFLTGDRRAYDVALEVAEYSLGAPHGRVTTTFDKYTNHPNPKARFDRSSSNAYRIALKAYELTGDDTWKRHALRWRDYFLSNSPGYLDTMPATFHVTNYLARTLAMDHHLLGDPRVAQELTRVGRWQNAFMQRGHDERGLLYCYLGAAHAWWVTRDESYRGWTWHTYLKHHMSETDRAQGPGDFTQTHFYELGQLSFFLRACREAGYSEANPPPDPRRVR
jgi:hypothetical protein